MKLFQITLSLSLSFLAFQTNAQTWTVYNTTNSSMITNEVTAIGVDYGWLFVSTENGGVARMREENWSNIDESIVELNCSVTDILVVSTVVWLTTDNICGLIKMSSFNLALFDTVLFNYSLSSLDWDNTGTIWIGNYGNGGLYSQDLFTSGFQSFNENNSDNPNDYVHGISVINDSTRWVVGTHEVGLMADSGWTVFPNTITPWPLWWDVEADGDSAAWFATNLGLIHYDGTDWILYDENNSGMPSSTDLDDFPDVAIDFDGNKWVASNSGLVKFDGTNWTVYNTTNSALPSNTVRVVEVDSVGNLWVGTINGLLKIAAPDPSGIEQDTKHVLKVYPNPAEDQLSIFGLTTKQAFYYEIGNSLGQLVTNGNARNSINVQALKPGSYVLRIYSDDRYYNTRFIK